MTKHRKQRINIQNIRKNAILNVKTSPMYCWQFFLHVLHCCCRNSGTVRNHPVVKQNYGKGWALLRLFCLRFASLRLYFAEENMKEKIKLEFTQFKLLLRSVPGWLTALFVMSVFAMNILANKSISLPVSWLALDCGIIVSWFAFLAMDTVTRRFGPKGATQLSIVALSKFSKLCDKYCA